MFCICQVILLNHLSYWSDLPEDRDWIVFNVSYLQHPTDTWHVVGASECVLKECRSKWHLWQRKQDREKHEGWICDK